MGVATREHRRCHMAGTRSSMHKSQSPSIDARADWWLDDVHGETIIFFLKNHGTAELRTRALCGGGVRKGSG